MDRENVEFVVVIIVVVIAALTVVALSGCAPLGVVEQEISPGYYARVCDDPDPVHVKAWRDDLARTGKSDLPMPLPFCEDIWVDQVVEDRPETWGDRLGWQLDPGLPASYAPACGGPVTDYQTGVVFCARDNDRDRGNESGSSAGRAGAPAGGSDRPGTDTPGGDDGPPGAPDGPTAACGPV